MRTRRWLRAAELSLTVAILSPMAGAETPPQPVPQPIFLARSLGLLMMAENESFSADDFAAWAQSFWAQFDRNGDGVTRDEIDANNAGRMRPYYLQAFAF